VEVERAAIGRNESNMKPAQLLQQFDDAAIVASIAAAESLTTGEIRVFVSRRSPGDAVARATRRFHLLHMHRTPDRNAVLVYLAPRVQKFAVIGDEGVHRLCGQELWDNVAALLGEHLKQQRYTAGVVAAIGEIGRALALHFPSSGPARNDLPNEVLRD